MATFNWRLTAWLMAIAGILIAAECLAGEAFRVDTELFQDQEKKPYCEQLTIFTADGIVYDFCLTAPQEAMVFDSRRGVFTLLDETRRVKATVTTQELLGVLLTAESRATKESNPLVAFCAAPKFETTEKEIDRNGQTIVELRLTGKPLAYVIEGQRFEHPEAVRAYRQFADWCARLNATQGNLPAAARLAVNQALAERDLLPLEITRTIGKRNEARSQHRVNWALSREDEKKIEHAGDMIAKFQLVSYDEYRAVEVPAPAKQAKR